MDEYQSLSYTKWKCKYHVVFIPKCRRRTLYEQLREHLGHASTAAVFKNFAYTAVVYGCLTPDQPKRGLAVVV